LDFGFWKFKIFMMIRTIILCLILIVTFKINAQLSPGDLSEVHANLEGLSNCTKCHEIGKKVISDKCLACHRILNERIIDGKGLHSKTGYEDCSDCHSEHHGRQYKLIYWNNGQDNFDHKETGFELQGKHFVLKCNECHSPNNIKNQSILKYQKKDLNRTFLGLSQNCLNCHLDEHRGQVENNCLSCHNMQGWIPAQNFDHSRTKFSLTGLHSSQECKSCHKTITDNKFEYDESYLKFTGLKFDNCLDCHKDPHNNKFGHQCEGCHNTSGWQSYATNNFDHNKTGYALKGKHTTVKCVQCHGRSKSKKISNYSSCLDCHNDYHSGQFRTRLLKGKCEECHSVNGFSPARFTIQDHNRTTFLLTGAHLAIPCLACHKIFQIKESRTIQFDFASTNCESCHKNPHQDQVNKYINNISKVTAKTGCEFCHSTASWSAVQFDHTQTQFVLEGRHKIINCNSCHIKSEKELVKFVSLSKECSSCHEDIHRGQFKENQNRTDCSKCHKPVDWFAEKFDHEIHSSFTLEGAHINIACEKCHKDEKVFGITIVRYKPLNSECKSCHSELNTAIKGNQK
jgi:hypothetical protein